MSRRIDIELTSDRADGTWTWRAAGAKQPKGVLRAELLPQDAAVGQELRADIEFSLDGSEVIAVLPPKTKNRSEVQTLEILARPVKDDELVTSKLAGRGGGRDRGDRGDRRDRGDRGDRGPRRDGDRKGRDGDRRPRPDGDARRGGGHSGPGGTGGPGGERSDRGSRPDRPRRERPAPAPKPKAKRLRAGRTHRKAALEALPAAEQVIAEQVLLGGIPAVRQAVDKQNEFARANGGREVAAEPLIAIAERLLPDLRAAEWRDKAEAALADMAELDLRDLRSVVVAAETGAKDDSSRELASQLREGLSQRLEGEQTAWLAELTETLAEGRVVRALRLSSRPPKAGAPLPADLATKLAEAASASLTAETVSDRWATVLDALSFSPVRLLVAPASKPETPSDELVAVITRMADRVPKVAEAFGIDPASAPRKSRARGGAGGRGGAKPRPPKPPKGEPTAKASPPPPAPATEATPADEPTAAPTDESTTTPPDESTTAPTDGSTTAPTDETPTAPMDESAEPAADATSTDAVEAAPTDDATSTDAVEAAPAVDVDAAIDAEGIVDASEPGADLDADDVEATADEHDASEG